MSPLRFLAAALALAALPGIAAENNKTTVENKLAQCQGCHGVPGWKTAFPEVYQVPKLGGQKPAYIVNALKAYKAGERDFPTMRAIAADLSDQDIQYLAKYYGGDQAAAPAPAAPAPAAPASAPAAPAKGGAK